MIHMCTHRRTVELLVAAPLGACCDPGTVLGAYDLDGSPVAMVSDTTPVSGT